MPADMLLIGNSHLRAKSARFFPYRHPINKVNVAMKKVEIISRGRCVEVSETQLDELRIKQVSWYAYCQKRLTMKHEAAIQCFAKK